MPILPMPADMARDMLGAALQAGGQIGLYELKHRMHQEYDLRIALILTDTDHAGNYFDKTFDEAIEIAMRSGAFNSAGSRLLLTQKGYAQAGSQILSRRGMSGPSTGDPALSEQRRPQDNDSIAPGNTPESMSSGSNGVVDLSEAADTVNYRFENGAVVEARLDVSAARRWNGQVMTTTADQLLDDLYRVDGSDDGFAAALRSAGCTTSGFVLLEHKAGVRIIGRVAPERRRRGGSGAPAIGTQPRRGRRPGKSWDRVVCEIIAHAGGHADLSAIMDAAGQTEEAEDDIRWRERVRDTLRKNQADWGKRYFAVAELNGKRVYSLTEAGARLAERRFEDERAPNLSKHLAAAVRHDSSLSPLERYVLLFLATRLGHASTARLIHAYLPADFPDEDSYARIPMWITEAEQLRQNDAR